MKAARNADAVQQPAPELRKLGYPARVAAAQRTDQDDRAAIAAVVRLAHDVGKQIARAAHNAQGSLSPALHAMLLKDLYALAPGVRPSLRACCLRKHRIPHTLRCFPRPRPS